MFMPQKWFRLKVHYNEQLQADHKEATDPLQTESRTLRKPIIQTQNLVITDLLQLFKMLPQELHRTLRLSDAEVHNALFQDLLDVVLLHKYFTALQTFVFFQSRGGGGHLIFYLCGSGTKQGGTWEEGRESREEMGVKQGSTGKERVKGLRNTERRGKCTAYRMIRMIKHGGVMNVGKDVNEHFRPCCQGPHGMDCCQCA